MSGHSVSAPSFLVAARARWPRRIAPRRLPLEIVVPAFLLLAWHVATSRQLIPPQILPAPMDVLASLRDLVVSGDLASNLVISMRRVGLGFALGATIGIGLGAAMGLSPGFCALVRPGFMAFAQFPTLGFAPLLLLLLGMGETMKIVLIAKATLTPVALNTLDGVRAVPPKWVELTRVYRFTRWQTLRRLIVPATLPPVFTGLRYGLTQAWNSLVLVELLASTEGLGYLVVWSRQLFQLDTMLAVVAVIGLAGYAMDKTLSLVEARLRRLYGA
ncbi:MAG TPA: ABC transporter permease [Acetobacteraceae bacterium]|nr:ABC transporter permease [Acetobacteraceae bacterium]